MDTTSSALINAMRDAIKRLPDGYEISIQVSYRHKHPWLLLSCFDDGIENIRVDEWEEIPELIAELVDFAIKLDSEV